MEINTGSMTLALANAEREIPDLAETIDGEEANDLFSPCVLTMLVGESGPAMLVVLDLPPGLQLGDEDEQPKEE